MGERSWASLTEELYGLRRFGVKPGLKRIRQALNREGLSGQELQIIMIGGTNGKGTVSSMISAILQGHGKRVGLYTSPHLLDVRERFRVNGRPLSQQEVRPVLTRLLREYGSESGGGPRLTFFEMTTLAAAILFSMKGVDVAVMEVGLGGRWDAVNALEPDLSVVTTIGRDHTEYLGTTIEQIALEKAGIFRRGVPAVIGAQEHEEATRALQRAGDEMGAMVELADRGGDTLGEQHQRTALRAAEMFLGEEEFCLKRAEDGLRCWRWPGRFEEIPRGVAQGNYFVDAAHNSAGIKALRNKLRRRSRGIEGVIWAMMRDKDVGEAKAMLEELGTPVWGVLVKQERGRGSEELAEVVPTRLWRGAGEIQEILREVDAQVEGDILIFGSVFLVGEVFQALGRSADDIWTYSSK